MSNITERFTVSPDDAQKRASIEERIEAPFRQLGSEIRGSYASLDKDLKDLIGAGPKDVARGYDDIANTATVFLRGLFGTSGNRDVGGGEGARQFYQQDVTIQQTINGGGPEVADAVAIATMNALEQVNDPNN